MPVLEHLKCIVFAVISSLIVVIVAFIPIAAFQLLGLSENPDLDMLSRCIGFLMALALIMWYTHRK